MNYIIIILLLIVCRYLYLVIGYVREIRNETVYMRNKLTRDKNGNDIY